MSPETEVGRQLPITGRWRPLMTVSCEDEELRNIATEFASLLRPMVESIDKHGLKKWFLTRHMPELEKFFSWLSTEKFDSEAAQSYQKRFEKTVKAIHVLGPRWRALE